MKELEEIRKDPRVLKEIEKKDAIQRLNRMTVERLRRAVVAHNMAGTVSFLNNCYDAEEEELRKDAAALNMAARKLTIID